MTYLAFLSLPVWSDTDESSKSTLTVSRDGLTPLARALPTEFELRVRELQLTAETYIASRQLRAWYERNKNRCYVPEWLLEEGGITVDLNFSAVA